MRTALSIVGLLVLAGVELAQEATPQRTEILERAERNLAQLEVQVDGPPDVIGELGRSDFVLVVHGQLIEAFDVDRQCPTSPSSVAVVASPGPGARQGQDGGAVARAGASYLFYFDETLLTLGGRITSIAMARKLIGRLVEGSNRATIVSAGNETRTFAQFTSDTTVLASALDRLEHERSQIDAYATTEGYRQEDVLRQLELDTSGTVACGLARHYELEEQLRIESALAQVEFVLGRFVDVPAPRVVVYFADIPRLNPGAHYFVGLPCPIRVFDSRPAFRRLVEKAVAMEVRFYAVQAEGLTAGSGRPGAGMRAVASRAAQNGLKAIALDTGGDAFLNGARPEYMARRIAGEGGCTYLLSFDPRSFPEDRPLVVRVDVKRHKVHARTRSMIVLQSEGARRMSRLLAAFSSPETVKDRLPIGGAVVPIGIVDGRYTSLVQAALPPALLSHEEWDVGVSVIAGGADPESVARRITLERSGLRAVFEVEMAFRPGPYEVVLVAQESLSGRIATGRITGSWPGEPDEPGLGPLALLQPATETFVRGDDVRSEGSLAVSSDDAVHAERSMVFVGLVCRGERRRRSSSTVRCITIARSRSRPSRSRSIGSRAPRCGT
jgi:VWFA-related protein